MRFRRLLYLPVFAALVAVGGFAGYASWSALDDGRSRCRGTASSGSLEHGVRLNHSGANFRAYSTLGFLVGRTFMHRAVRDTIRDAYADLAKEHPDLRFIYAEASWPDGGRLRPHRTHANGTSVDFLVPARHADGSVTQVSTAPWKLLGYANSFDKRGWSGSIRIDFDAMALHLQALAVAGKRHGVGIRRVIFDVDLQPRLLESEHGQQVRRVSFNRAQAWVRHDDHYHVDFEVRCD